MCNIFPLLFLLVSFTLDAQTVKVMTYNIRLDTEADGINQWKNRTQKVSDLIKKSDPDVLGVQEAMHNQIMDLKNNLPAYAFVGVGRDDGKEKGEYSAIFYKKDKYEVLQQNTFWLSETPEVAGSKSWDAAITRVATWALMKENASEKVFLLLNTHFDHIGKEARKHSAEMIKAWLKGYAAGGSFSGKFDALPILVTGDFNSEPNEEPYQVIINGNAVALFDSRPAGSTTGTFCSFKVNSMQCKTIDYIFHSNHWLVNQYQVIQDNDGAYYPSDHLPVMATLQLKK
jgi:endonuclease/exonuclease/phosphatase family metal-dependent hydrolase